MNFLEEITSVINKHNQENHSDTPDWILADYLIKCLEAFNEATIKREKWYKRSRITHAGKSPRKFWVEIQNIPVDNEPPEFTEAIFIQRNREDLDNVGEVFQVTEDPK